MKGQGPSKSGQVEPEITANTDEPVAIQKRLRRRDVLKLSAAAGGAAILAACTPEITTASPTPGASASTATSAAPNSQATASPAAFAKLEGPTIVTDPAKFPTALKEAPELATLVQQGKLPPVAQRVGQDQIGRASCRERV